MINSIAGSYMAFAKKGNCDEICSAEVLIEVTDFGKNGEIELVFNADNLKDSPRIYLKVSLPALLDRSMKEWGAESA